MFIATIIISCGKKGDPVYKEESKSSKKSSQIISFLNFDFGAKIFKTLK